MPGLKGSLEHSLTHSQAHPAFQGHSLGHLGGDFGPFGGGDLGLEGPEDSCKGVASFSNLVHLEI